MSVLKPGVSINIGYPEYYVEFRGGELLRSAFLFKLSRSRRVQPRCKCMA